MGFMLPLLWDHFYSLKNTVLFGFLVSVGIEILQIFTFRTTDINDLITNTVGTLLGYLLIITVGKRLFPQLFCDEDANVKREVSCVFVMTFLTMFFITPLISDMFWNVILA